MSVKIGSCFAGIGGFELGLERAIPNSRTIWQVEQNKFCQEILKKHWPDATIFEDVRTVGAHNLEPIDLLCGGFPCQDISIAGKKEGIHDSKKSSLFWELHRIISELRPRIICLENVANIIRLGGTDVVGSLAQIGYDCEWTVIRSGADFGAPHERKRWFCVAYPNSIRSTQASDWRLTQKTGKKSKVFPRGSQNAANTHSTHSQREWLPSRIQKKDSDFSSNLQTRSHWSEPCQIEPTICRVDDGISSRLDRHYITKINQRLKALGNAIVPQASEWIGHQIVRSGLIDDLID